MSKTTIIMAYQTNLDPGEQGGGNRYVQTLVHFLSDRGWPICFLGKGVYTPTSHANIQFIPIAPYSAKWPRVFGGIISYLLRHRLPTSSIAHIHRAYFAIPFVLVSPRTKLVCTLHGDTLLRLQEKSQLLKWLVTPFFRTIEISCLASIDHIIAVDAQTAAKFQARYPYQWLSKKLTVIPSFVDDSFAITTTCEEARSHFQITPDQLVILFVGRLAPIKNIPFLLRSFLHIEQRLPNAILLIAGTGEAEIEIKQYATNLGLKNVRFLGTVHHSAMPTLMAAADVLTLCSQSEASPIVIKEALVIGLPVVTTRVGDVGSLIDSPEKGSIVEEDEQIFANAILAQLSLRTLRLTTSSTLPEHSHFSAKTLGKQIETIYHDLSTK